MMDAGTPVYILLLPEVIKQKCKLGTRRILKSHAQLFSLKKKMKSHRTFITAMIFAIP